MGKRAPTEVRLLLGRDFGVYGELHCEGDAQTALAISTGSDPQSPSIAHKGDPRTPNEDAVLSAHDDERVLLAVADAHHGNEASHALLSALAELSADRTVPREPEALEALVAHAISTAREQTLDELERGRRRSWPRSRCTLCIVVLDPASKRGYGLNYGDSRALRLSSDGDVDWLSVDNYDFMAPFEDDDDAQAEAFDFELVQGDLIAIFSDGVHECCYTRADLSIGEAELAQLRDEHGDDANGFVEALGLLALAGVDGNPGGEDNIGIAADARLRRAETQSARFAFCGSTTQE